MRQTRRIVGLAFALAFPDRVNFAQGRTNIEIQTPFRARALSGVVTIANVEPAAGALVEECTKAWKEVLDSTHADGEGRFHLRTARAQRTYYLRLPRPGFNPLLIKVRLNRHAGDLVLSLQPST